MALEMQQQVEFYLSESNLSQDKYLQSLMDASGWIPLKSIVAFPKMKKLNATTALVAGALRFSSRVEVSRDESWVRGRKSPHKKASGDAGHALASKKPRPVLADMGLPPPAAHSTPLRKANAQVVILELSATEGLRVLLQLRSKWMPVMPGHLATVGGCRDRTDPDSLYSGMREAVEETGLTGGLMYPPVKFAEGAKVDWFVMQLQSPKFGGKQDLGELDDVRSILHQLPPSACPAECFGHVWLRVSELHGIHPSMPLMGGMVWKIRQAAGHLSLPATMSAAGPVPTAASTAKANEAVVAEAAAAEAAAAEAAATEAEAALAEAAAEAATSEGVIAISSEEEEEGEGGGWR